jgi:hypothetical protein
MAEERASTGRRVAATSAWALQGLHSVGRSRPRRHALREPADLRVTPTAPIASAQATNRRLLR